MERNTKQLEEKIEYLEHEIYLLKCSINKLAITYLSNPKYPYWSKLLCLGISDDKKKDFEFVLSLLSDRLSEVKIIVQEDDEITDDMFLSDDTIIIKSKAQSFPKELFINSLPVWEDVNGILCSAIGISNLKIVKEILLSMRSQEMFVSLIDYLLAEDIKNEK